MKYLVRTHYPFRQAALWPKAANRFFTDDFFRPFNAALIQTVNRWQALAIDVSEDEANLKIEASLPGINPDEVEISVHDGVLTIKSEGEGQDEGEADSKYYLRERHYGSFQRAIRLPVEVDADQAEAIFENGVLHLTLPKAEEAKPKRIAVKAG